MKKACGHTSVGVLVLQDHKLLVLDSRKLLPYGLTIPAGHVDQDNCNNRNEDQIFQNAARRELLEETSLTTNDLKLVFKGRVPNPCPRGSTWHYWHLYTANVRGEVSACQREAFGHIWFSAGELAKHLAGYPYISSNKENTYFSPVYQKWFTEARVLEMF